MHIIRAESQRFYLYFTLSPISTRIMPGENCPVCQQYFTKKEIRRHIINCRMRRAFNIYSQVKQKLTLSQQGHFASNPYVSDDLLNHETQHQSSTDIVNNNPAGIL